MLKAISPLHLYVKYVPVYIKERDYLPRFLGGNECLEPLHPILKNMMSYPNSAQKVKLYSFIFITSQLKTQKDVIFEQAPIFWPSLLAFLRVNGHYTM